MSLTTRNKKWLSILLNGAATVQLVWFYLAWVPSYLNLVRYEQGGISTPFQYRMAMMLPLRLAHASAFCNSVAAFLSKYPAWFPHGVRPESFAELPVGIASVVAAGLVARALYCASSPSGILSVFVYPLTLLMVMATYASSTMHRLRFVYDMPSLGLFAAGLYLIYFMRSRLLFALLFLVATVNRETTLFLLFLYLLRLWADHKQAAGAAEEPAPEKWYQLRWLPWREGVLIAMLGASWLCWHVWVVQHFAANESEARPRILLNIGLLLVPISWLQVGSCFAFCGPLLLLYRRRIQEPVLRAWFWIFPIWGVFMLKYGLFLEPRIFGELIPYVACIIALGIEQQVLSRAAAWLQETRYTSVHDAEAQSPLFV